MAPGQVFPVPLKLVVPHLDDSVHSISFNFTFKFLNSTQVLSFETPSYPIIRRQWGGLYKFTYQGFDGSIQYAMAKPPLSPFKMTEYPVVIAFHGAGVDAELPFWTEAYNQQSHAWVLYPTGRSQWGFDWHGPSLSNVQSSLEELKEMPGVPPELREGLVPDITKLVYSGHSNGGQGAWWFLSHFPDLALAGNSLVSDIEQKVCQLLGMSRFNS